MWPIFGTSMLIVLILLTPLISNLRELNFFKVCGANVFGNNRELKQELKLELETLELLEEQN
jgi:hypothetical protein